MIIKSSHPNVVIPEGESFPEFVLRQFQKFADTVAMISPKSNRYYFYSDLIRRTHELAHGFHHSLGLRPGDVLATAAGNNCEFLPIMLAVGLLGGTLCTANPAHTVDELIDQFNKCRIRFLITTADLLEKMREVHRQCPTLEMIILQDAEMKGTTYLTRLFKKTMSRAVIYPKINPRDDVFLLLSSSGTTGVPKAVMLTHYTVMANLCQMCPQILSQPAPEMFKLTDKDVVLSVFPQFHIGGISNGLLWPLLQGAACVIFPRFEPNQFIDAVKTYQVTTIVVPPPVLVFMLKSPNVTPEDFRTVQKILCGAAAVSKELSEAVMEKFKPKHIIQGYGMTELSPVSHMTPFKPLTNRKHGSCGVPLPNTEVKVIDIETGQPVGPMQNGEICVRGPQIMKGYLKNPEATAECIDKDGWMHTGDIGHFDEDGYFFIEDRIKELIKVKGFQVSPAELESILITHPSVDDAAVIGLPDEYKGEIPRAYVILKNGQKATEQEIKKHLADRVASYKRLEGGVKFVKELPKTASGKILRRLLRDQARREDAQMTKRVSKL